MEGQRFSFGEIMREVGALFAAHTAFLIGVTLLVAGGYIALDLLIEANASSIPTLVVSIFVQYLVVERLLANRMTSEAKRRYGAVFIAGLLGGLGILLGFVFLVVPGIILAAGWFAATPFIVVDQKGGVEALKASWRATATSRWQVVLAVVVTYLPIFAVVLGVGVALGFAGAAGLAAEQSGTAGIIVTNIFASVFSVWGWVLGVAVYNLAVPFDSHFAEVFG